MLTSLWEPFWVHQLKLVSPSPPCSIVYFLVRWQDQRISLFFYVFFDFYSVVNWDGKFTFQQALFFSLTITRSVIQVRIGWSLQIIITILLLLEFFHTSISWLFFTGVWVTASLFKSTELYSVFCLILVPLYSAIWFLRRAVLLPIP